MNIKSVYALISLCIVSLPSLVSADTIYHRVIWDSDPSSKAVIAFSPNGSSNSPYLKFGYTTDESQWSVKQVSSSETFSNSLTSYFVRLSGLNSNSAIYYRICDDSGCGQRLWFKTASTTSQPFVAVAGGDTRSGWTTRREGNKLIAKLRPLFIMHGGDFTNSNNSSEMKEFLSDWELTFSDDTIDGIAYKRIYPLVPTHGNHEDNNYKTLCQVFGIDFNDDSQCTSSDTYGSFNVTPLLRVYTLNSQYKNSGWSSYATAMNNWFSADLSALGSSAKWRFAQYHKPMFPHYTGKSDNIEMYNWWANSFYDHAMNLVVESDTHINKITKAIVPNGSSFNETTSGGTVYVGEGSWGAPARSANDPKSWTVDLASIQQFKVITVMEDRIEVKTAQFDSSASTLTREERMSDSIALPSNVNWWSANSIGETLNLIQSSDRLSIIDTGEIPDNTLELSASDDTFVSEKLSTENFDDSSEGLLADASDSAYGEMMSLIKWDLSDLPSCSIITAATIKLNVFNSSSGNYQIYSANNSWSEESATWTSVGGNGQQGTVMASFNPSSTGNRDIVLSGSALSKVNSWLDGSNNGVVVASNASNDGIDFYSREQSNGPKLYLVYEVSDEPGCGGSNTGGSFNQNELSGAEGSWKHFPIEIPTGMGTLNVSISGGDGDGDLYVRNGSQSTSSQYDCRPWKWGNDETCSFNNPSEGTWYLSIQAYYDYDGVNLNAEWQP